MQTLRICTFSKHAMGQTDQLAWAKCGLTGMIEKKEVGRGRGERSCALLLLDPKAAVLERTHTLLGSMSIYWYSLMYMFIHDCQVK